MLVFKGEGKPKKSKKKKKSKYKSSTVSSEGGQSSLSSPPPPTSSSQLMKSKPNAPESQQQSHIPRAVPCEGTGRISCSGTVVTGHDTQFTRELAVGDAILVKEEMRVITMLLSDTSLNVSSTFSNVISTPVSFSFMCKPRSQQAAKEKHAAAKAKREAAESQERHAFGIYGSTERRELVYRERTEQNSYRIKKVAIAANATRTDLLDMRTKKKSDKFC